MSQLDVLKEARRLHALGLALIWIHPRSKRPVESGWTTGPRTPWARLEKSYRPGMNLGVRTGTPSLIEGRGYLACIDVDVKDPACRVAAETALEKVIQDWELPEVRSGSGQGSRHLYCVTPEPFKMITVEKHEGWEICIYSDGRQMVLPPSIHPSGRPYEWKTPLSASSDLLARKFEQPTRELSINNSRSKPSLSDARLSDFKIEKVDLSWLPISDEVRAAIESGVGVDDRSGYLMKASSALLSAGLTQNEVLSVLTDPKTYLGQTGYDHAKTKDRSRAAAWIYRYTLERVGRERSADVFKCAPLPGQPRKLSIAEQEEQAEEFQQARSWQQDLVRGGQHGTGAPQKLVQNVVTILTNEVGEDVVARDEFAYRDAYRVDTPWGGKTGNIVSDDDVAVIKHWLGEKWGFEPNRNVIEDALVVIAKRNAFDPVRDALDQLEPWDGVDRLNTWLRDYFEAKGEPEYLAQVFRKWMVAMILRIYEPGAKFDWMPIFEGAQGVGKSSFGRLLVGDKYFLDWLPNLNDKDSALSLQGMWGVEMGELSNFKKNELEVIKAFITRTVDKLRPPYGKRLIESPRRCVFFGTTNRKTYLTDETGNRRFKPVMVGSLDFEVLRRDRLQLFAEAKWLYDQKKETERTLDLEGAARVYERQVHDEKMVSNDSDVMREAIEDFVEKIDEGALSFDLEKFRILDLFEGVGPLTKWKPENRNTQFAGRALEKLKFEWRFIRGKKYWKRGDSAVLASPPPTIKKKNETPEHQEVTFI